MVIVPLFAAALAAAPAPSPTPTLHPIAHLVVTSDRSPESAAHSARTTYVITHSQIVRNGYLTVADALARVPGVDVERYGGFGSLSTVSIRGWPSEEVLVLIDGMPAGGAQLNAVDLDTMPTTGVRRIEVVEGGGSTLYGSGSIGGVVNIITSSSPHPSAAIEAGSFGSASLSLSAPYVAVSRTISASDYPLPNGTVEQNADAELSSVRVGFTRDAGPLQIGFGGSLVDEHVGVPGAQGAYSPTSRQNSVNRDARLSLAHNGPRATLTLALGASTVDLTFTCDTPVDPQCPNAYLTPPAPYASLLTEERTMADLHDVLDDGGLRLIYGVDLTRGSARVDDGIDPLQIHPFDQTAAYVQSQWFDARDDEVYAGLRGERDGVAGGALSPSVGGIERLFGDLSLRWNAATAFRAPSEEELYYPFFSNPRLVPEKVGVGDVSLSDEGAAGGIALAWFTSDGRNLIADNPVTFVPENIGHAILQGLTLDAHTRSYHGYTARLAVTNLYRAQDLDTGTRIADRGPAFTIASGITYVSPAASRFDGFGLTTISKGPRGIVDPARPSFDQPVAYTLVDAYVGYRLGASLVMTLRGYNLTNARYSEFGTYAPSSVAYYAYPVPGRSFAIELRTR